jgi:hypothetical protein
VSGVSVVGAGFINNGPGLPCQIMTTQESQTIWSMGSKADEKWSFTDAAGHFHAYDQSSERDHYPTLLMRVEQVPCVHDDHDDDCDGANTTHWHCRICDEEVEPGRIPGPHSSVIAGLRSWEAKVGLPVAEAWAMRGERVSLRMVVGENRELFGLAMVDVGTVSSDDVIVYVDLVGIGPLGSRKVKLAQAANVGGAS